MDLRIRSLGLVRKVHLLCVVSCEEESVLQERSGVETAALLSIAERFFYVDSLWV